MNEMYTSRSAIEAYRDCPRYRYNQYMLGKCGVVAKKKSVPLVSGGAIHTGVEHMLNRVRIGMEVDLEKAISCAVEFYDNEVKEAGFRSEHIKTDYQQWFTFMEQRTLVEGLIRCWHKVELPRILEKYHVIGVEREIEPIEIAPGVMMQAKVDAEFRHKENNDIHAYSLKTMRSWGEKEEASYANDLQGITETWALEQDIARHVKMWELLQEGVHMLLDVPANKGNKNLVSIFEYFTKKKPKIEKVMGVRFCFLIKGVYKRSDYDPNNPLYITYSPLTRGYKRVTPSSIEYAHSWFYPNPNNQSGKGALGKGWEPFNVWELEGGAKKWFEMLESGEIQPACGDIISQQVITPMEYFRDEEEIKEAIREIAFQESVVRSGWLQIRDSKDKALVDMELARTFPHNRKHCEFHFGGSCEYKELCWAMEVRDYPLESGLYQIRVPHHEKEREIMK